MSTTKKQCVSCGRCLSFCPVFLASEREEWSPKAKNRLFECLEAGEPRLDERLFRRLAEMCVSCGRCVTACAQHLSVPERLAGLRARHPGWEQYLWKIWIAQGDAIWPALGTIGRALGDAPGRGMLASVRAMGAAGRVRPWLRVLHYDTSAAGRRAMFFAGCTARRVRPQWAAKGRRILAGLGYDVVHAKEACCGGTLASAGLEDAALAAMRANVAAWRAADRPLLVTACVSCLYSLHQYADRAELFEGEGEAKLWSGSLAGLASLWGETTFEAKVPASLRWHAPCHAAGRDADRRWLQRVSGGAMTTPGTVACCGLGGVAQLANRALSLRVAEACWNALAPEDGAQVLTGCSGCTLQLQATRPEGVSVAHWLDIVDPGEGPGETSEEDPTDGRARQ